MRPSFHQMPYRWCAALVSLLVVVPMIAAERNEALSRDGLWRAVTVKETGAGAAALLPAAGRLFRLDVDAFLSLVAAAPLEGSPGSSATPVVLTLPMPDGWFARFRVEESPIMEPGLAMLLPKVRTYRAYGIDVPEATARLDFTPRGFHGFVLSPDGTVFIDPWRADDIEHYVSILHSATSHAAPFHCELLDSSAGTRTAKSRGVATAAQGAQLRIFRLAIACTGEYTAYHGGTVAGAQAAIVTTMNRVNGIYEKDLAVRMMLVDNSAVCYTNSSNDPYANSSATPDLVANQSVIDYYIGSDNYDVGHLFGTGPGGSAYRASICDSIYKGRGQSGLSAPTGEVFNVGYVAHEMGHQFGARHSFNGTTGGCGIQGGRSEVSAYEPGGGSTIMAYAGLCGAESLQSFKDPNFHARSIDEITEVIAATGCGTDSSPGNTPPAAVPGLPIVIPASTPFFLTGSATDGDGDAMTYSWEQFDLGAASPPNTDNGNRPIFRSFPPAASATRTFPRLQNLLANTTTLGESLPTTTRTMTFRFTVRDNRGGVDSPSMTVSVVSAAGPFLVTAPNTQVSWTGGAAATVTWNVAGTTSAPVSCANVKLLLSTDGGNTFPSTLLASTANDGTQVVTVPPVATSRARVRVECATAPFFDLSNVDFTIETPVAVVATATTGSSVSVSYTPIGNAASYEIHRRTGTGAFALIGTSATASFTDPNVTPNTAYLYAVKSVDGGGYVSPLSGPDLATTVIFTDPALTAQVTHVKAAHLAELRTGVNAVRALAGLSAFSFTNANLSGQSVKAVHVTELRNALDAARTTLGITVPTYAEPLTSGVTPIRTAHVEELRNAVK